MHAFHAAFLITFSLCYLCLLALELPFLIYYPLEGIWSFTPLSDDHGPAMTWYGLVLASLVPALAGGMAAGAWGLSPRLLGFAPFVPTLALVGCVVLMRDFFLTGAG
ncbi:MAG: hypothetical protein ABR612_05770 [Chromatocurvus sp.]